jgi:hypothetical protein
MSEEEIERVARALWRLDWPADTRFSKAAPNDWDRWPETPRQASWAYVDHSKEEYREQARVAIATLREDRR